MFNNFCGDNAHPIYGVSIRQVKERERERMRKSKSEFNEKKKLKIKIKHSIHSINDTMEINLTAVAHS